MTIGFWNCFKRDWFEVLTCWCDVLLCDMCPPNSSQVKALDSEWYCLAWGWGVDVMCCCVTCAHPTAVKSRPSTVSGTAWLEGGVLMWCAVVWHVPTQQQSSHGLRQWVVLLGLRVGCLLMAALPVGALRNSQLPSLGFLTWPPTFGLRSRPNEMVTLYPPTKKNVFGVRRVFLLLSRLTCKMFNDENCIACGMVSLVLREARGSWVAEGLPRDWCWQRPASVGLDVMNVCACCCNCYMIFTRVWVLLFRRLFYC
jgi:hypothetical protein